MRHRRKGRKLNRNASHRLALFRNLSRALITHESIQTTLPKAKELRSFFEKLVTLAKNAALLADEAAAATDEKEIKRLKARALHLRRLAMAGGLLCALRRLGFERGALVARVRERVSRG